MFVALLAAGAVTVLVGGDRHDDRVTVDPVAVAEQIMSSPPTALVQDRLPAEFAHLEPITAARRVAADPRLAMDRVQDMPRTDASDPMEAGLAALLPVSDRVNGWRPVAAVFAELDDTTTGWLAVVFPEAIGNLTGAGYPERIAANRIRVAAALAFSQDWPGPPRPWTDTDRRPREDLEAIMDDGRRLIQFDPLANDGQGSWVELRGDPDRAAEVAVLVPGGSAFIVSDNFGRYSQRARSFVDASHGELAMIVWAGAPFPSGWIEEAQPGWARDAAPLLADFMNDLRNRLDPSVLVTLAGHSYGGAIVGLAETHDLAADRVVHVASAGAGYGVDSPLDYTRPCRARYTMMAPGDPIGYVQDVPGFTGLGHGISPADLAGVRRMSTGWLPDDPDARDDVGRTLGSQGIAGKPIGGVHAHSEVFIPDSDAWRNLLTVFTGGEPELLTHQPEPLSRCR